MGPAVGSLMSQYKHLSFSGMSSQLELTQKPGIFPDTASVFAETAVCGCKEWREGGLYKAQAKPPDKPPQIWTSKQADKVKHATNKHEFGHIMRIAKYV